MSRMRGDLLSKTRKLVQGLVVAEPKWLKAMERAPPPVFPKPKEKPATIVLPEDKYVKTFYERHPDALTEESFRFNEFNPPPVRVFASRVLELKNEGLGEAEAISVADSEYRAERKNKKAAFKRLKQIARQQGKKAPPNPYPSAIKEVQAEEKPYLYERFNNPKILQIVEQMKIDHGEFRRRIRR
eukprot:TRINITY_DN40157_c0_g1_i1.p1 TRINITY_DN40157_c0_g1~~TRINITY_DN40157_c0_g1_i1.p1  ORF type:complete len:185 (-),score=46.19 TRINITY_DN40157_c0_g1_i1:299-853(-)